MTNYKTCFSLFAVALSLSGCNLLFSKTDCHDRVTCSSYGEGGASSGGSKNEGGASSGGSGTGGISSTCDPACEDDNAVCNSNKECVECTEDKHCDGVMPFCDVANEACVGCIASSDCTEASASRCEAGACEVCTADADCSHIAGKNNCETGSGACVECVDSSDCGGNVCNPLTNTCSKYGTTRQACESCDTDENCSDLNHFCVPMQYDGKDRSGGYCLKKTPDCLKPFFTLLKGRDSLSGAAAQDYCGVNESLVTCEAVRALLDDTQCPGGMDSECPESGLCKDIGGVATNRCTYRCVGVTDCKEAGAGSTCGITPNNFCGYVP